MIRILIILLLSLTFTNPCVAEDDNKDTDYNNVRNEYLQLSSYDELLNMSIQSIKTGEYEVAERILRRAVHLKPKAYKAWQLLTVVYIEMKDLRQAYICAKNAYVLKPNNEINKFNFGQFFKGDSSGDCFYYDPNTNTIIIKSQKGRDIYEESLKDHNISEAIRLYKSDGTYMIVGDSNVMSKLKN